jgi:N utilization substance protein B
MGDRRRGREFALQMLFQIDLAGTAPHEVLEQFWTGRPPQPPARDFAERLVRGVSETREEADRWIAGAALNWKIERMSAVDRNVLRIAVYELLHDTDTPPAVVIDEAIEVARKYGGDGSARFVNGVLDAIRRGIAAAGEPPVGEGQDGHAR